MINSITLESYQIPRFYAILERNGVESLPPRSDYEVYHGQFGGSEISIHINGQVSHDVDRRLQELIDQAMEELDESSTTIPDQKLQSAYMILARPSSINMGSYQINHLNIWLNREQYYHAVELFIEEPHIKQLDPELPFVAYRFVYQNRQISFHHNGKVIAEEGYALYAPLLAQAIRHHLPFEEFDLILGQDEVGNGERIGPLVVGAVGATPRQLVDLQLVGVKDSKMVPRSIIPATSQWIRDISCCAISREMLPMEFNQIKLEHQPGNSEILTRVHNQTIQQVKQRLKELGQSFDKMIYIIDRYDQYERLEALEDDPDFDVEVKYIPHAEKQSTSVAAASLLAKAEQLRWIRLHEKVHQIRLTRKNLAAIRKHPKSPILLKSI